jgi:hypothetical protein
LKSEPDQSHRHYHYSKKYYEDALQRLQSNNFTSSNTYREPRDPRMRFDGRSKTDQNDTGIIHSDDLPGITIILNGGFFQHYNDDNDDGEQTGEDAEDFQEDERKDEGFNPFMPKPRESKNGPHRRENPYIRAFRQGYEESEKKENMKSKNFQVIKDYSTKFSDVGGYEKIKDELRQSIDILRNYGKYAKYNVRIP